MPDNPNDERREVRAIVRTYLKDGESKNVYATVGTAWVSPHASTITVQIDSLPISKDFNGKLYLNKPYEPKDNQPVIHKTDNELTDDFNRTMTQDNLPTEDDEPINLKDIKF